MVDGYLSLPELARQLGVSTGTIDEWIRQLDLDVPRSAAGRVLVPPELLPLFETVRNLREQDRSYGTIQKVIGHGPSKAADGIDGMFGPDQLLPTLQRVTQLANDYAKATHRIGQLEARIAYLEAQLAQERSLHRQTLEELREFHTNGRRR